MELARLNSRRAAMFHGRVHVTYITHFSSLHISVRGLFAIRKNSNTFTLRPLGKTANACQSVLQIVEHVHMIRNLHYLISVELGQS
jgi:hypothetical protein